VSHAAHVHCHRSAKLQSSAVHHEVRGNTWAFRHSSRNRPVKLSITASSAGFREDEVVHALGIRPPYRALEANCSIVHGDHLQIRSSAAPHGRSPVALRIAVSSRPWCRSYQVARFKRSSIHARRTPIVNRPVNYWTSARLRLGPSPFLQTPPGASPYAG
jgi:hypothetical protein